jgi:hypothetical protein
VESDLLESIQRDLFTEDGFMVFMQEVTRLFADRSRQQGSDHERARRQLGQAEATRAAT